MTHPAMIAVALAVTAVACSFDDTPTRGRGSKDAASNHDGGSPESGANPNGAESDARADSAPARAGSGADDDAGPAEGAAGASGAPAAGSGGGGGGTAPPPGDLRNAAVEAQRFLGAAVNATALQDDALYAERLASEFNSVTPENALKWAALEPSRGIWNFAEADRIVAAARAAGQSIKGHTFVWHTQLPSWTEGLSTEELANALHEHIHESASRYKGQIYSWDVVNEAIASDTLQLRSGIHAALGVSGLAQAFKWVKEEDPDALLFYNDFGIEEPGAKTDAVVRLIEDLRAEGAPIDGVGLQAHLDTANYPSEPGLRATVQRFAALGLKVSYSELDVKTRTVDPNGPRERRLGAQSLVYQLLGGVCASEPSCPGITLWGFSDKFTWIVNDDPLIFDADFMKKPSYEGLLRGLRGTLPSAGPNLINNGDFANGTTSWIAFAGGSLSAQTAVARSGSAAIANNRTQTYQGPGQVLPNALASGDHLCLGAFLRVDAASARVNATLKLTASGVPIYTTLGSTTASNTEWAEISGCRPVYFAGQASENVMYFEGPAAGVTLYADDVSLWTLRPN